MTKEPKEIIKQKVPPAAPAKQPRIVPGSGSGLSESRRRELADFLRTRREKTKPTEMGLTQSLRRRTPGLRREEVAEIAGVGTTWYTWLEQARDIQPSSEVLRRLGQALKLGSAEMRHMFALAGKAPPNALGTDADHVPESLMRFLANELRSPAMILGGRWDILATNAMAAELLPGLLKLPKERQNWLYYVLCSDDLKSNSNTWEADARRLVGEFRSSLSDSLDHPQVMELVSLLRGESASFETWWREHDVPENQSVTTKIPRPGKGVATFERLILHPWENPRLKLVIFSPLPD